MNEQEVTTEEAVEAVIKEALKVAKLHLKHDRVDDARTAVAIATDLLHMRNLGQI